MLIRQRGTIFLLAISAAMLLGACKKKGSSSSGSDSASTTTTSSGTDSSLEPSETTAVTLATLQLQLAPMVTILPGKDESLSLLSRERSAAFTLTKGQTLRLRVNNEAFEAVDQAGSIMCLIAQTKFWEQANNGAYKVQVDENACSRESGGGEGGGEQQSSQQSQGQTMLTLAYVKATREEGKPLLGEFRISADQGGDGSETGFYHVKVIIVAPPDDDNPAGIFDMRFTQHAPDGKTGQYGFIRTRRTTESKFLLEIGMGGSEAGRGEHAMQGAAELEKTEGGDFAGYVRSSSSGESEHGSYSAIYKARFDESYLNVVGESQSEYNGQTQEESVDGCYDRNAFKTAIYRYDLLNARGEAVTLNSGFPAEYEKDGKTYNVHASYWGLWIPGGIQPATGDTLYKVEWGNQGSKSRTPYTIFAAPGKLVKMSKATVTLGDLKGVDLGYWSNGNSYIVKWNGSKLAIVSRVSYGNKGMEESEASGDVEIPHWGVHFWVSSLSAGIQIPYGTSLSNSTELSYHAETTVSGTDELPSGQLVCFDNCPVMNPAASAFQRSQGSGQSGPAASALYKTASVTWGNQSFTSNQAQNVSSPMATYTFDATAQVIKENGVAFALPALSVDPDSQRNMANVFSGALIPIATWQALSNKAINPGQLQQEVETYYRWTSGAQPWSRFQAIKDEDGAFVNFDKPLEFTFELTSAAEFDGTTDTSIVGKSYRLSYGGSGQLHGIPWKYNASVGHEMPLFSLKAGVKIGAYTVNPLEGEQRMAKTDSARCSDLSLDTMPDLPTVPEDLIDVGELGDEDSPVLYIGGVATAS